MTSVAGALMRRPVLWIFVVALGARLALAVFVRVTGVFRDLGDQETYLALVEARLSGDSRPGSGDNPGLWLDTASYLLPIEALFRLFGSHVMLAQLPAALAGAATAAVTAFAVSRFARPWVAAGAGLIVALYPSQLLWSSLVMKDAFVWMGLVGLAAVCWWWSQLDTLRRQVVGTLALVGLLVFLAYIRDHTTVVAALAVTLAAIVTARTPRAPQPYIAVAVLVLVPKVLGMGWAGVDILSTNTGDIEYLRNKHTIGSAAIDSAATGTGWSYLPRGLRVMLLDPLPHQVDGVTTLQLALVEQLVWLPLLLLAVVGLVSLRHRQLVVWYTFFVAGGTAAMWAMIEGNYVTAFRHRGEFLWAAVILAALGVERGLARRQQPKTRKVMAS